MNEYEILKEKHKKSPWKDDPGRDFECTLSHSDYDNIWKNNIIVDFECENCGSLIRKKNITRYGSLDDNKSRIELTQWGCECCGDGVHIRIKNLICPVCKQLHKLQL